MAGLLEELFNKVNTPLPGQINYNDPANFHAPQDTGPMGLLGEAMGKNMAKHPIYGGVGQNMGENVTYDNVNSLTGLPNPIDPASIPPRREMRLNQEAPPAQTSVPKVETPKITKDTTLGELHEIEVTAKRKQAQEMHNTLKQEGAQAIQESGGTEDDLKGWDKFTDDFDLQMVGMALLASNDGSGSLMQNLGKALMLGRQAADKRKSDEAQSELDWRKENREERDLTRKEQESKNKDIVDRTNAATNIDKVAIQQEGNILRAKATVLAAQIRASAEAAGMKVAPTNATTTAVAQLALKQVLGDSSDKDTAKQLAQEIGGIIATEQKNAAAAGQSYDPNARAIELTRQLQDTGRVQETGMFTPGDWELGKLL